MTDLASALVKSKIGGVGRPIEERAADWVTPEDYFATGDGDQDDTVAVITALDVALQQQRPFRGLRTYKVSTPIVIDAENQFWDGTSCIRPVNVFFNRLITTSIDAGVRVIGSAIQPRVVIGHLIGPGIGDVDVYGGDEERIGVVLEGEVDFSLGSATDFNFGVVLQNAFSARVRLGYILACRKGIYAREHPIFGNGNQNIQLEALNPGGVYTNEAFGNDALRRARSCELGVHLAAITGSSLDLGAAQYCQIGDTGRGVQIDEGVNDNAIRVYLEGAREDGDLFHCEGSGNQIFLSGMGSVSDVPNAKITVRGAGNDVWGLNHRGSVASIAASVPNRAGPIVRIGPGNRVNGRYITRDDPVASALNHSLVSSSTAFTRTGNGSATTDADCPSFLDPIDSFKITCNGDDAVRYETGGISLSGENLDLLKIVSAVKGHTGGARVAYFVIDNATNAVIGDGVSVGVRDDTPWQLQHMIERIPAGVSAIRIRIVVRAMDASGCVVLVARPMATFNLEAQPRRVYEPLPHQDIVPGRVLPLSVDVYRPLTFSKQTVIGDIVSSAIDLASRPVTKITAHASGSTVSTINGLADKAQAIVINASGTSITFSAVTGSPVLAAGEAMTIYRDGSTCYRVG